MAQKKCECDGISVGSKRFFRWWGTDLVGDHGISNWDDSIHFQIPHSTLKRSRVDLLFRCGFASSNALTRDVTCRQRQRECFRHGISRRQKGEADLMAGKSQVSIMDWMKGGVLKSRIALRST